MLPTPCVVIGGEAWSQPQAFRIVGIGASAGGLESLEQLFSNLPSDSGMAFVVVQHLSPDFRSMMDELLSRHSAMPVELARDEVEVEPNHVYLLPPGKEMIIRDRRLLLSDKEPSPHLTMPIDLFFRSLAQDAGPAAVGVVLSGSGSDGSRGIVDIKRAGGCVFVEAPETAKFDGMPLAALATGTVDRTAAPSDIPRFLLELGAPPVPPAVAEDDSSPMSTLLRLLRDQFGLDFSLYKTTTVTRRVLRRVEMNDLASLDAYVTRLERDPDELGLLYHDLLIGVTRFFRDPEAFAALERVVVPDIIARTPPSEEIRVWVAGCATGEEAYSIAMMFVEQLSALGRPLNVRILATDVHRASLARASAGLYDEAQLEHVSEVRRLRFFLPREGRYQVTPDLRQIIVFAPHNLTKDAPFTKMQLISCRNMLIYLEPAAQKVVLSLFHFGLATGGVLFLGSSESPGDLAPEFTALDESSKLYRKRRDVKLLEPSRVTTAHDASGRSVPLGSAGRTGRVDTTLLQTYDTLLDRYMPPAFLVDEERRLVDSFGGAETLLTVGRRRPSMHILDMLEGDLRLIAAAAIRRALAGDEAVRYEAVAVPGSSGDQTRMTLTAEVLRNAKSTSRHVLLTLTPTATEGGGPARDSIRASIVSDVELGDHVAALERELSHTRENLQATVEELQASNEELQATNEELITSNEELQTTNEELHSVNEELYTVNGEHQRKIADLRELNADIQHLLEVTDVGMLFIDRDLRIRKYTPHIAKVFRLQPTDVGRNIRDFASGLDRPDLFDQIEQSLTAGTRLDVEARDQEGRLYFLRVLPYRPMQLAGDTPPSDDPPPRGEGVVVSVTDISALERTRESLDQMSRIVESSDDAIIGKALDGTITSWNQGAADLYGYTAEEAIGRNIRLIVPDEHRHEVDDILSAIARGERVRHFETVRKRKDGRLVDVSVSISPIFDRGGDIVGASVIARDVSALGQARRDLEEREAHIRLLLDSTAEAIYGVSLDGVCTFVNSSCVRMLGHDSADDFVGRDIATVVRHVCTDTAEHPVYRVLRTMESVHSDDGLVMTSAGHAIPVEFWGYPVRRGDRVVGAVVTFVDTSDRKRAEDEIRRGARRREQFLAMLSHELRNPLAAILNATEVMKRAHIGGSEAATSARNVIARQSAHMSRLLDDLFDVARITRGGLDLKKVDFDLRTAIEAAVESVTPLISARATELTLDLPGTPLGVRGDPARLQQVVGNLLSNASRYSPPGARVRLTAFAERDDVVVTVRDWGRGIPANMLSEIFELFVQSEQGLDRPAGGLGVGLSLVRQIVELHGGTVEARSDGPGTGSEFTVRLRSLRDPIQPTKGRARAHGERRRIVLVEDQPDARQMMRALLEYQGHIVSEAADGESALEVVARDHPDVALIDIGLPALSGYDVARRLRQNPAFDDILLVALTGYGTGDDVRAAREAGFDEHLTKPSDPDRLAEIVGAAKRRTIH